MGRMLRGLRIWRAVLTLLLFLWWDSRPGPIEVDPPRKAVLPGSNGGPAG